MLHLIRLRRLLLGVLAVIGFLVLPACSMPECAGEETFCSDECKDLKNDAQNCGACGNACAAGTLCTAGQCVLPEVCGDGRITASERCDDGNTTAGDGCGATCAVETGFVCGGEPSRCMFSEVEPNDTLAVANPAARARWSRGRISSESDVDVFRITLPATVDLRLDTFDGSGAESCVDTDTLVELLGPDGEVLASDDDDGLDRCSTIEPGADLGARNLAPGVYFVRVSAFNSTTPAYVMRLQYLALCGNGQVEGSELCDDGNTAEGDACSAACRFTPKPEREPNDTPASASGSYSPPVALQGAINPGSEMDVFRITLSATADLRLETFDSSGRQSCRDIDTQLELLAPDGTTVLASDDDDGVELCGAIHPASDAGGQRLAPGTYYARVSSFGDVIPGYILMARYDALCGDGRVTGSEECDGTAGCTASCERTPVCGDGFTDYPEFCDDGNTANGDACASTCASTGLRSEVEPNDTRNDANARASDPTPILFSDSKRLAAALPTKEDVDVYRMQVSSPSLVRLETFHGGVNRCESGLNSRLALLDTGGTELATDMQSGVGTCPAIALYLSPGTYYVQTDVVDFHGPASYALDVAFQGSAGSETEPNDTRATANSLGGVDTFVAGSISTTTDVDYYRITVPAGASVRAETHEGDTQSCDNLDLDSDIALLDASGRVLASDDDSGRGYCSRLDGMGPSPDDVGASNLLAGTYYLRVRAATLASTGSETFNYRLSVTIR
jgi:cysteine-rich repeat protein